MLCANVASNEPRLISVDTIEQEAYLIIHEHILLVGKEQVTDPGTLSEPIVITALPTTPLALGDGVDEACHHVELRPVDLGRVVVVVVGVSLVSANKVGKMDFPGGQGHSRNAKNRTRTNNAGIHAPLVLRSAIRYF